MAWTIRAQSNNEAEILLYGVIGGYNDDWERQSAKKFIDAVKAQGGVPVGVGLLVDRSGGKVNFGMKTEALLHLNVETYKPEECPLCAKKVPMTQRGRTGK